MNEDLKIAIEEYCNIIKTTRPSYIACYNSFLAYCSKFSNCGIKRLFKDLSRFDIEQACKEYFISSEKAEGEEAIRRFLSAIDMFYSEYLLPREIFCEALEKKCRNQEVIQRICKSLNQDLHTKIYLPLAGKDLDESIQLINELNTSRYYQLGQKIIFNLLRTYGFKEQIILNMKREAFDAEKRTLTIYTERMVSIVLNLPDYLYQDLKLYMELNPFLSRKYMFTITTGEPLNATSILHTAKYKAKKRNINNFTPTSIALSGIVELIKNNFSVSEINKLMGFELQKIVDVADSLLEDKDINLVINEKLERNIYR